MSSQCSLNGLGVIIMSICPDNFRNMVLVIIMPWICSAYGLSVTVMHICPGSDQLFAIFKEFLDLPFAGTRY